MAHMPLKLHHRLEVGNFRYQASTHITTVSPRLKGYGCDYYRRKDGIYERTMPETEYRVIDGRSLR